ncbi:MarR family winged helix-turn-helix transcriptional regulator [Thalassomonas sp. RHCl1]|uniref:MarR family winged helix-turn-helix transcriptional regulator n=1 Tax=Thalassomonas sp. RHCl1 TaxID=2995320 RepID=UPI00248AD7DF|nr:MarR family winged helix-turn-helix transcriptional regulator [Thalassomonas sp. RHCl1]
MKKKRTVHEVAFRLSYDLGTQITPQLGQLAFKPAPMQLRAMRRIWSTGGATLLDIARTLNRDKSQVKRLIDELCEVELVKREPNPADKRSKILKLTNKGYDFFETIEKIEAVFSEQLTAGIPAKDLEAFFRVSDRLSDNLRELNKESSAK